jgi:hypothetical protein
MSDCLHCDIHDLLKDHLEAEQADLSEIAAKVTEVLADLILLAAPEDQTMLLAQVLSNFGSMYSRRTRSQTRPTRVVQGIEREHASWRGTT